MLRHHKSDVSFQIEHSKTFLAAKLAKILLTQNPADFGCLRVAERSLETAKAKGLSLGGSVVANHLCAVAKA